MGYQQEVVERVVRETGQTEDTFLILERIVEESKRCEEMSTGGSDRDRRSKSNSASPEDPSSSLVPSASRLREERELSRVLADAGKSKENIQPRGRGGGLGHRRQCSGSEAPTQQVDPPHAGLTAQLLPRRKGSVFWEHWGAQSSSVGGNCLPPAEQGWTVLQPEATSGFRP